MPQCPVGWNSPLPKSSCFKLLIQMKNKEGLKPRILGQEYSVFTMWSRGCRGLVLALWVKTTEI
jgi:hypothetical protein